MADLLDVQCPEAEASGFGRPATGNLDVEDLEGFQQVQDGAVIDRQRVGGRLTP